MTDHGNDIRQFVTFTIGSQLCGIPVLQVRDVLAPQEITPIPLAPPAVAGSLNLRGRIVTSVDLRVRLGLPTGDVGQDRMSKLSSEKLERVPATSDASWSGFSNGIYRLDVGLLLVLDIDSVLDIGGAAAAA